MPLSLVENEIFGKILTDLDPKIKLPIRKRVADNITNLSDECREYVKNRLIGALGKISITADIWSKKSLTTCYLGVTAHCVSEESKLEDFVLDFVEFPHPHTGERISELIYEVLCNWGLVGKAKFIVTDNASNMVCAFKNTNTDEDDLVIAGNS